jgi:hypothetical protein
MLVVGPTYIADKCMFAGYIYTFVQNIQGGEKVVWVLLPHCGTQPSSRGRLPDIIILTQMSSLFLRLPMRQSGLQNERSVTLPVQLVIDSIYFVIVDICQQ